MGNDEKNRSSPLPCDASAPVFVPNTASITGCKPRAMSASGKVSKLESSSHLYAAKKSSTLTFSTGPSQCAGITVTAVGVRTVVDTPSSPITVVSTGANQSAATESAHSRTDPGS